MRRAVSLLGSAAASGALVVLVGTAGSATAGTAAGPRTPGATAPPVSRAVPVTPGEAAVTAVHRIRLITGQTVLVRSREDGTSFPRLQGGGPFVWTTSHDALYVVPRMPVDRLQGLDLSLFDTAALARVTRHGRTPVVIHLRRAAELPRARGLRLAPGLDRSRGSGTVVHAVYGPRFRGLRPAELQRISSIRLDAPVHGKARAHRAAPAGPTHTVTVHVTTKSGNPSDWAVVNLENTVDGDAYDEQVDTDAHGVATFTDVPEGQYSVLVGTFSKVLVNSQFDVTADTSLSMSLGDATVKPQVTLGSHRKLSTATTVQRDPDSGWPISWGSSGSRHFDLRLQPTTGQVDHGDLNTEVSATMVTGRKVDGYANLAMTADAASGIPHDLTYVHHREDFARWTDVFYGNGPTAPRPLWLIPGNMRAWLSMNDVTVSQQIPGRLHVWMQAARGMYLQQTVFALSDEAGFEDNTQIGDVRTYHHTGPLPDRIFLHGPVGPGLELPARSPHASTGRHGNALTLSMPTIGGAGSRSWFNFADARDASWSLRLGARTLAHGHQTINRSIPVPPGPRTYRLLAESHPGRAWDLSTRVSDVWTFHSRSGHRAVAVVTPRYLPPSDLAGDLAPGHTGFRLGFHSTRHSARIAHVSVELSTNDGRTWRPLHVARTSALTFHVGYRNPAAYGDRHYASLRVTARDVHGNSVRETALHAYRLR